MKRTLIAAAVLAAASGSVFADSMKNPYIFNATMVGEQVGIEGFVRLFGCVSVSSTAGAVVNNTQAVYAHASLDPQAQSYMKGAITTRINDATKSVTGTGTNSTYNSSTFATAQQNASTHSSSSSHTSNASTTVASASNYAYGNQSAASASSESHKASDSGHASNSASAFDSAIAHSDGNNHSSSKSGNFTGTLSQGASSSASLHTEGANYGYGWKDFQGNASEQSSAGASGSFGKNRASSAANSWGAADSGHLNTSHTDSQSEHKNSSQSWAAQAQNSGSGNQSASSTNTYAHTDSKSSTESHSGSSSYATASSSTHNWGYSVNDTLKTVDETTSGSVTQYVNTQAPGTLNAGTGNNAASGVSGNLGINVAQGIDNAQSNDVALASVDVGNVFGNAQIFNKQSSGGSAKINNFNLNASIGDGSLSGVTGNVGVNVASGIGNVQNNSLAGAVTTTKNAGSAVTTAMVAADENSQNANMAVRGQFQGTAMLGANTLAGASGNIGVNIAGGAGNLQHNGLAIAALNSGH